MPLGSAVTCQRASLSPAVSDQNGPWAIWTEECSQMSGAELFTEGLRSVLSAAMQRKTFAYPKPFSFVRHQEHRHSPLKNERYLFI